jgi:hypothetical protein
LVEALQPCRGHRRQTVDGPCRFAFEIPQSRRTEAVDLAIERVLGGQAHLTLSLDDAAFLGEVIGGEAGAVGDGAQPAERDIHGLAIVVRQVDPINRGIITSFSVAITPESDAGGVESGVGRQAPRRAAPEG